MKKADTRRKQLANLLLTEKDAIPGAVLSEKLGVSRQIIVQDVARLKADGFEILSTHNGYVIKESPLIEKVFKVRHTSEETAKELGLIVDQGGYVVNVFVRHKVYGVIEAPLNIGSRYDVEQFMEGIKSGKSSELMHITSGYHYHTVRAENDAVLSRVSQALLENGYLVLEDS